MTLFARVGLLIAGALLVFLWAGTRGWKPRRGPQSVVGEYLGASGQERLEILASREFVHQCSPDSRPERGQWRTIQGNGVLDVTLTDFTHCNEPGRMELSLEVELKLKGHIELYLADDWLFQSVRPTPTP